MQQELTGKEGFQFVPRYLWFLISTFSMVILLGNWFDLRLIKIVGIVANAGTFIFAFTFFLSTLITEVYGYKYARLAIWWGFLFNIIVLIYSQLVIHLPSPSYHPHNAMFDILLQANNRAIIGGLLSYFASETLNSFTMAKLKLELKGRFIGARFIVSTIMASSVDSALFGVIAFYNSMDNHSLISLIFGMLFIKFIFDILLLPLFIYLAKRLKEIEAIDIYDKKTRFTLFSLDTDYSRTANRFVKEIN